MSVFLKSKQILLIEGPGAMIGGAVVGGIILAMIEGVSLGLSRISGQMQLNEQSKLLFIYLFLLNQKMRKFNF